MNIYSPVVVVTSKLVCSLDFVMPGGDNFRYKEFFIKYI